MTQQPRPDGWYWIRLLAGDDAEPARWLASLGLWQIGGAGYRDSELAEIGPVLEVPAGMRSAA